MWLIPTIVAAAFRSRASIASIIPIAITSSCSQYSSSFGPSSCTGCCGGSGMWAGALAAVAGSHVHLVLVGLRRPAAVIGFNFTARFLHSTNCPLYGTVKGVPVGVSARSRFTVW